MASDKATSEIRGDAPRSIVDMLDAVSHVNKQTRFELVLQILEAWRELKVRETVAITRVVLNSGEDMKR